MKSRRITRGALCCLATVGVAVAGEMPHKWHSEPVSSSRMADRITQAAEAAQHEGRQSHAVLYDIGYPHSAEEYRQLGGCALLYLAALTQAKDDLPIKRAYVVAEGHAVELREVKVVLSEQAGRTSLAAQVFGPFRSDALYLLPISFRLKPVELFVEFGAKTSNVKVTTFGTPLSPQVKDVLAAASDDTSLDEQFLAAFIRREYPGFEK